MRSSVLLIVALLLIHHASFRTHHFLDMAIIGIVAVDRAGAIGKGGSLPWRYSADLKHFKEQTSGHAVVMGRRTWASLKRPLPNRLNIVLSRGDGGEARESVLWLRDAQSVLSLKGYLKGERARDFTSQASVLFCLDCPLPTAFLTSCRARRGG